MAEETGHALIDPVEHKAVPKLRFKAKRHMEDISKHFIELEGGIVVTYGDSVLEAGRVTVKKNENIFDASENVILTIPSEQTIIKAHRIIYNYQQKVGEFINVYMRSGFSRFRAKKAVKIGPRKYEMYDGTYTTCDVADEESCPWRIWSHKSKVMLDGYATVEHPVFLVEGFPLLYSPFAFFPIKKKRQTGFLMPELGASDRSGFSVKNSLFLALGRSHDTTLEAEYFSKRGIKGGMEYRFMLDDLSQGQIHTYYLRDREFKKDFGERDRFAVDYDHQLYFAKNLFNKAEIKVISDDDYVKDFDEDIGGREDAGLEAKLLQGWNFDNFSFNLEGLYYESLVSEKPRDSNKNVTHKLPEFRAVWQPTDYFNHFLNFGVESSFVYFANEEGDFQDFNSNTIFDEGVDHLKRAHRMDIFPKLRVPFRFKRYFEFIPSFGYRETQWWLPVGDPHKSRRIVDLEQAIKTNVGRVYYYDGEKVQKIKHVVEPTLSYHYSPFAQLKRGFPLFDAIDDIESANRVTWGVQNRFVLKIKEEEDKFYYFDGIRFGLSQDFDIDKVRENERPKQPLGPLKAVLTATVPDLSIVSEAEFGMYGKKRLDRVSSTFQYDDPFRNNYLINYTFSEADEHNSINGKIMLGFLDVLKFYFFMNYSFDDDSFLEKLFKTTYFPGSKCWALNMVFRDSVDQGFSFNASVNLLLGEQLLSLAKLRQKGELNRLNVFPEKGDKKDVYFEDDPRH